MYIKSLTIKNFRSYYGEKRFTFGPKLNLIIGSNGDGKTTLFEALDWVLSCSDKEQLSSGDIQMHVSAKLKKVLPVGFDDEVLVETELMHQTLGRRIITKKFKVTKQSDGNVICGDVQHTSVIENKQGERFSNFSAKYVLQGENFFPYFVKKYSMFHGEETLNIFQDKETLNNLLRFFSDIKDLAPIKDFVRYGERTSNSAIENFDSKKSKKSNKIAELKLSITILESQLERDEMKLEDYRQQYMRTDAELSDVEKIMDSIEIVRNKLDEIKNVEDEIADEQKGLEEGFSFKLLTKKWILTGFDKIIEEFANKMNDFAQEKTQITNEFYLEQGKKEAKKEAAKEEREKLKKKMESLPWYIPDTKTMESMLKAHRCLVCDREMTEGDHAYNFMKQRLDEALAILNPKDDEDETGVEEPFPFSGYNVDDIHHMSIMMYPSKKEILSYPNVIRNIMIKNDEIYANLRVLRSKKEELEQDLEEILATSKTGVDLVEKAKDWGRTKALYSSKEEITKEITRLSEVSIPKAKEELKLAKEKYAKELDKTGDSSDIFEINTMFTLLQSALNDIEEDTYHQLTDEISSNANSFMTDLNTDDFTGDVVINRDKLNKKMLTVGLYDNNGEYITKPNTSLKTTMYISVLLSISELSRKIYKMDQFPLILDAPTSSFDSGKDRQFFELMDKSIEKQCIIVTKSYLNKTDNGQFVVDEKYLGRLSCPKYRIQKKGGFDKKDLSTIDTQVSEIKL